MVDLNQIDLKNIKELSLSELKSQSPANLLKFAEKIEIDNASTMRKGDMMFAILKEMAENGTGIVVSSHQLNELERFVEGVAIMNQGKIVTQGSFTSVEHDLGVGQRLMISGIGPSPASIISENPLITVDELDGEGDWCLRLTRHDQTWSQDLRAALIERINKGVTKVASLERVPPDLEEILRTATGISAGINLQEEE